jgi:DNA ligase 1
MTALWEIIKAVQAASGANAKKAVLELHKDNALLRAYLKAVYDPTINYWTTKVPKVAPAGLATLDAEWIEWLTRNIAARALTGKAAMTALAGSMSAMDAEGIELAGYIIGRDIKAGIAEGGILKVFPGLFYVPPYQRCASMSPELKERFGQMPEFYVQTKSDGQFAYAGKGTKEYSGCFLMSRAGSHHPHWLADTVCENVPTGTVAMGELLVFKGQKALSRKEGNGILNSLLSGDGSKFDKLTMKVEFFAWDLVTLEEFEAGHSDTPYRDRWIDLVTQTSLRQIPSWVVTSLREANALQAEHVARGEEGTVWKSPEMLWRDCSSGDKDMMKAKLVFEADFRIRGCYEGTGKAKGKLGGLELETCDGLIQFNVGSGFSDIQREELWAIRDTLPGKIAACEGNDIVTSKGKSTESIFLPIFIEIREDKVEADTRDRVWEQFNASKAAKSE